jgi:tetratricopeptide (TPR) repeat protein
MTDLPPDNAAAVARLAAAIQQANDLEQSRQIDAALAAYQGCLRMIEQHPGPILAEQLMEIWMGFGFCAADRNDWPGALEWYLRAEAMVLSAPAFSADPHSAEASALAQKWTPFMPNNHHLVFMPGILVQACLGRICESIALAYDNAGQLSEAGRYYQRALDLFRQLDDAEREAAVWMYQAVGYRRREDWDGMIEAASQMLAVAERAQDGPGQLEARRLLTQAHVNQRRFFRVLEHLTEVVRLARQLGDARLPVEEGLLRDTIAQVRPAALERNAARRSCSSCWSRPSPCSTTPTWPWTGRCWRSGRTGRRSPSWSRWNRLGPSWSSGRCATMACPPGLSSPPAPG